MIASGWIVLPEMITAHIMGCPVAAVKPKTVKWLQFVVATSFATVPLLTIFFLHLLLNPLLGVCYIILIDKYDIVWA